MDKARETKEIDIIALFSRVLSNWKLLLKFAGTGAVVGVIIALSIPKTYKAEVSLAPELSSGGKGLSDNLADMAANFGIEIGGKSSMDAIYPELYPDVFSSTDFIMKLFDVPVRLKDDDRPRSYLTHVTQDNKIPFWEYPKNLISELLEEKDPVGGHASVKDRYKITRTEAEICRGIRGCILCSIDKKTSVINISVTDQDPLVATIMADTLQKRLQEYITSYRTNKACIDYEYYKKLAAVAKQDYEKARQRYASTSDANSNVALKSVELYLEDMENDMQLKFNTYSALNNQLQAAKAKVQERTPAFTIIQRPIMPFKASSTPRSVIVILFVIMGCILDAMWVLFGDKIIRMKKRIS